MHVSEARRAANVANSAKSTGPKSNRGKIISRSNSLKHGLSGDAVVIPEGDQAEVERRIVDLEAELQPQSSIGSMLIRKIAAFSVRSERCVERENAEIDEQVRKAPILFDIQRGEAADDLFNALLENPRGYLRRLKYMPEGVDRLLDGWRLLRDDLVRSSQTSWLGSHLVRAAKMSGLKHEEAQNSWLGAVSRAIWGDFSGLTKDEGAGLNDEARREWAKTRLTEWIDVQIAELEAHQGTLDLDRIEQDRRESPLRATFDISPEAILARRYEADADRGFYRALKEFRKVEAEAATRIKAASPKPIPDLPESRMGSFRETPPPFDRERSLAFLEDLVAQIPVVRGADGQPLSITRPIPPPV